MNLNLIRLFSCCAGLMVAVAANAQSANGQSSTNCQQTGAQLVCTTTTTLTLPTGTNLSGMALPALTGGPCSSVMGVAPPTIAYDTLTTVTLSLTGCPSTGYTYNWAPPLASNTVTASMPITLTANKPSQTFRVDVCSVSNPTQCQVIQGSVGGTQGGAVIPALTGCAVSPSAPTVPVGGTLTLSASCATGTGAGAGATYQWTRNGNSIAGATSSSYALSANDVATAGTYSYGVTISNAAPSSQSPGATVTVATPTGNANDACPAYPVRAIINASEAFRKLYTSSLVSNFTAGDDFVLQINVSANDSTVGVGFAGISFSDFGANRGGRWATVSQNKCDYTNAAQWITTNFMGERYAENAGSATVTLGPDQRSAPVHLTPGVWYLNIRNVVGSCPSNQACHAVIQWSNNN
ncbi:MAG: hypothetical protein JSS05_02000 [Proteobacteria bacterium]|nr:hypothetical protein [Pseudomonadota bacterium]